MLTFFASRFFFLVCPKALEKQTDHILRDWSLITRQQITQRWVPRRTQQDTKFIVKLSETTGAYVPILFFSFFYWITNKSISNSWTQIIVFLVLLSFFSKNKNYFDSHEFVKKMVKVLINMLIIFPSTTLYVRLFCFYSFISSKIF